MCHWYSCVKVVPDVLDPLWRYVDCNINSEVEREYGEGIMQFCARNYKFDLANTIKFDIEFHCKKERISC